jgi:hypothetical protein
MKRVRYLILATVVVVAVPLVVLSATFVAKGDDRNTFQWVVFPSATQFSLASDNSKITISGMGTFVVGDPEQVTGGGGWATFTPSGTQIGGGSFKVTGLVRFDVAPGTFPPVANSHAGLAFLRVMYDDGSQGILVVGCHLTGSPSSVAEGFSASKGFANYWNGFRGPTVFISQAEDF